MSCNIGFYLNNLKCLACHKDCKTCLKGGNDNDENCQSCNNNYYLVDASGFGKNCVSECPKKTILDKNKTKCISGNDDSMIDLALVIIGSFLFAIVLVMIIFGIRRCKKRRRAAELMIDDIKEGSLNLI